MQKYLLPVFLLFSIYLRTYASPDVADREVVATRINERMKIDGRLDEPAWSKGKPTTGFIQYTPDVGKPGAEPTKVTVLYDDAALYIGFMCYEDEPDKMVKVLAERDTGVQADKVQVEIDSYHDHNSSFFFEVNVSGTMRDGYRTGVGDNYDMTWDSVWESGTSIGPEGWSAELRIPYYCLRFNEADENVWGINFYRQIMSKNQYVIWHFNTETNSDDIASFGHLVNLKGIKPARHLEVQPYLVSSQHNDPSTLKRKSELDLKSDIGLDLKYGLTPNLTLDATINPDFGQVESDPALINLSTFETFYEEKRPFFIEGASNFSTYFDLFYSRRIGRAPTMAPDDLDHWITRPDRTTILGAAKLTGKTSSGWELGLLNAVTDKEYASYVNTDGEQARAVVMEEANFNILRIKKEFESGSSLGLLTTAANQKGALPDYSGGIDWNLFIKGREYSFTGQSAGSRTKGDVTGSAWMTQFSKNTGKHFRGSIGFNYESRKVDFNKAGFLQRPNQTNGWAWLQYRIAEPFWKIRQGSQNLNYWQGYNLNGDVISFGGNYNNWFEFTNLWQAGMGIEVDFPRYDDRETRGGPLVKLPRIWDFWIWGQNNNSDPVTVNVTPEFGKVRDGRFKYLSISLGFRPRENLRFSLGPSFQTSDNTSRWLTDTEDANGNRVDIFGELHYRQMNMNIRSTMTFKRNITLTLYSQIFVGAGNYENFKQLVPPDNFTDLTVEYNDNPDFNYKSFKLNAVFRWEYMPGSDLYVVWTQARDVQDNFGDFKFRRDVDGVFDTLSDNVFLAKINYWWNP